MSVASGRLQRDASDGSTYNIAASFTTAINYNFVRFPDSAVTDPDDLAASMEVVATIPSRMRTCFGYYHRCNDNK